MTPTTLALLIRTIRLCCEYHAGYLLSGDVRFAWGLADCRREIELIVRAETRQPADGSPLEVEG